MNRKAVQYIPENSSTSTAKDTTNCTVGSASRITESPSSAESWTCVIWRTKKTFSSLSERARALFYSNNYLCGELLDDRKNDRERKSASHDAHDHLQLHVSPVHNLPEFVGVVVEVFCQVLKCLGLSVDVVQVLLVLQSLLDVVLHLG